ncbi:glutaminyl-peptide cyclotransferase [Mycolicibacterium pulveris]|uniref:Glutaminyl-peptide cyclotransferase n=1 Tax=Mycolicibacterium pulveris TaxID=36813 RepID=A0A7I7UKY2_MYCPV|nr:glutaminyl-peptide cyclotransferase [Mycolicibacterium pulveris]MCV6979927.1 glutaminyl-peptide cyclotransferase [Mycolicibacterium pulveris]BBY81299.1 glutaminyl-peptide cyclotransferase [Mycolicibacterium pulveris]
MRASDTARRLVTRLATLVLLVAAGCGPLPHADSQPAPDSAPAPVITPVVLAEIPHDPEAWTQGLEFDGSALWEGTGIAGKSQLRQLDPATGALLRAAPAPHDYYGEGITVVGDRIWELTWRDGVAVEWDKATLTPVREAPVDGEGWGLCHDGERFVRSDGTDRLRFHDPVTFAETGSVTVTRDGIPQAALNELECVDGQVWANVWKTDTIVRIDPSSGKVNTVVDAAGLWPGQAGDSVRVLNGIAHLGADEYLLTGKKWPSMYRVRLEAR